MDKNKKEVINSKTLEDKENKMRLLSYLCRQDILICCKKCFSTLCNNSLIDKILRLMTGKIYFILDDESSTESSNIMAKFKSSINISRELNSIKDNTDLKAVGTIDVFCKKCKNLIGVKIMQSDETQLFMNNRFVLKMEELRFFILLGSDIKPLNIKIKPESLSYLDQKYSELDKYISKSGSTIQNFFDILTTQVKNIKDSDSKKEAVDKLGDVLKYLSDKQMI